jgi:hypothetical protein
MMGERPTNTFPMSAEKRCHASTCKEARMENCDATIAVFADHAAAEGAVKKLAQAGFDMKVLSVVGQGFHTEEKVVGFYNTGDRIKFWGTRGAFWGGFWGLFFSGAFIATPLVGPIIVLGYLAAAVISAVEGIVVVGGLSALGAALYSIGIPKDSVIDYEAAVKADNFLVMAHGATADMARAKAILGTANASRVETHVGAKVPALAGQPAHGNAGVAGAAGRFAG